jgi:hypothetical protein
LIEDRIDRLPQFFSDFGFVLILAPTVLVLPEGERIGDFVVGIESVDEVLYPNRFALGVIVEAANTGEFLSGSLVHRIVDDDVGVL